MRIPLSWLEDYVEINIPVEELALRMSAAGIPVETVEYLSPDVRGVYVGHIRQVRSHPDADRLVLCSVDLGDEMGVLQIVTGAPNVREGHRVPVAVDGALLSGGLKIKNSRIRDQESFGMMCSAKELGIEIKDLPQDQREGVLILPPDTPVGASLAELYCLSDPILEIESFANRPDQLSIIGIAREVAAILGTGVKYPKKYGTAGDEGEISRDMLRVKIEDYDLCRRYSGRIIAGVPVDKSPLWLQGRLHAAGIRAVNKIVDVTNYVMLETGQPLHAFDFDKIRGGRIIVRPARDGETIRTIDGQIRQLTPSRLVIADGEGPVAIAGVMGGLDSEVTDGTTRILLESANFDGASVRRTSIALGLRSESSTRFEKGIDFYQVDEASRRACFMLESMGGSVLPGQALDSIPGPESVSITLRTGRVNQVLGTKLSGEKIRELLSRLGFEPGDEGDEFSVGVPTLRQDINGEIDLVEEVARLYGYDNIPLTQHRSESAGGLEPGRAFDHRIRELLVRAGLRECITLSMYEEKTLEEYGISPEGLLRVKNPITGDQAILRADGIPHLVDVVKRNLSARRDISRLFEISNFYSINEGDKEPSMRREATIILSGPSGCRETDFFALKGIVEFLLDGVCAGGIFERGTLPCMHPNKCAVIMADGIKLGYIGVLHPRTARRLGLEHEVTIGRLFIDSIREVSRTVRYRPIPRFPGIRRDLALVVEDSITAGEIRDIMLDKGKPIIEDAACFDVYQGDQVPSGRKSLAFSLSFSAPDRTLTEEEVQKKIDRILKTLAHKKDATLR